MEQTAALIAALEALARAAPPESLRHVLHQLIDGPNAATPPVEADGAALHSTDELPQAAPPELAARTTRPTSAPQAGPGSRAPSKGLDAGGDWLSLREQVRTEQKRQGIDRAALAAELKLAPSTLGSALGKRDPPSGPIFAKLTHWLGDTPATAPGKPVQAAQARPGPEGREQPGNAASARRGREGRAGGGWGG